MIVQITMTRNELFLIKEMLPLWQRYADGFVFMDDGSTDGTYEFLKENAEKYNILSVIKSGRSPDSLAVESNMRQTLFDEALRHSGNIVCLDTDEYIDGQMTKDELEKLMESNKDTLFHSLWIQYLDQNNVRVDGPWRVNWMDRIGSYSQRAVFRNLQMHAEHLPVPKNQLWVNMPHLFIAHIAWVDKKAVALKQYYWKVFDYVNRTKFGIDTLKPTEYDRSVNNFNWQPEQFPFPLRVRTDIYQIQNENSNYKKQFIKESVTKYNIPNLNDWGMGIH
jgi:glycosyltransferase involved in cell wall biosynthesis